MRHAAEADRDQLRNPAFIGLRQELDRIAPVLGWLPASMRGAASRSALPAARRSSADRYPPGKPAVSVVASGLGFVLRSLRSKPLRVGNRVTLSSKSTDLQNSRNQIDSSVDIDRPAGDPFRQRSRQIGAGEADVHDVDKLSYRRPLLGLVQQQLEILQPGSRARL